MLHDPEAYDNASRLFPLISRPTPAPHLTRAERRELETIAAGLEKECPHELTHPLCRRPVRRSLFRKLLEASQ